MTHVTNEMIKNIINDATFMSGMYPTRTSQMEGIKLTQEQFEFLNILLNGYNLLWGDNETELLNSFKFLDEELEETRRLYGTEPTCDFDAVSIANLQQEFGWPPFESPVKYKSIYWCENANGTIFLIGVLPTGELEHQVFVEQNRGDDHYQVMATVAGRTLDQYYAWEHNDFTAWDFDCCVYQQQADFHNKHMVQHGFLPMVGWLQLVLKRKLEGHDKLIDASQVAEALIDGDYTPLGLAEDLVALLSDVLLIQDVYGHIIAPEVTGDEVE